jgi:hypothetical protein
MATIAITISKKSARKARRRRHAGICIRAQSNQQRADLLKWMFIS